MAEKHRADLGNWHLWVWKIAAWLNFWEQLVLCWKPFYIHHICSPVDLHLLEAPHAVQYVELLPAFGEIDLPVDEVRVPQVDKGQVLEYETPGRWTCRVKLWPSIKNWMRSNIHSLTGTGYMEAPLQTEQLCMLWMRRSCRSTCNTPLIPERGRRRRRVTRGKWSSWYSSMSRDVQIQTQTSWRLTSEVCFCHSNLRMGAESRADSIAR